MLSQAIALLILYSSVIEARRGGGSHSYPQSHGHSGTGMGGGGSHTYPQSHGHSGTGMGGGGSHTYPQSHGHAGTGMGGGSHTYPHTTGMSSNTHVHQAQTQQTNYVHKTEVHHHYQYSPPQQISYGSTYHPVYHAAPPVYVYEYRNSGSRFDSLLTGLALYNLGRMSASHNYDSRREYKSSSQEICKLGISKQNGEYEETRIDCKLMSSFIWEAETQQTTRTNQLTVTTITEQNGVVVDALQVKGPSIQVTRGMNCFMIRISRDTSVLKKNVECGLLQAYAQNSLHSNNNCLIPYYPVTFVCFSLFLLLIQV